MIKDFAEVYTPQWLVRDMVALTDAAIRDQYAIINRSIDISLILLFLIGNLNTCYCRQVNPLI